jgi:ribose 1,5-bisphosphokinase
VSAPASRPDERIGPGSLILVVGPSGAGKDTLIALARAELAGDPAIVFPRRIVTRVTTEAEGHESVSDAEFDAAREQGAFAFSWWAHGLNYALPASIHADIRAGRTVVCNVSRALVQHLRESCVRVTVVLVTAPREVLAARLAGRGRASDRDVAERLDRVAVVADDLRPDVLIENIGTPESGAARLCAAIRAERALPQL